MERIYSFMMKKLRTHKFSNGNEPVGFRASSCVSGKISLFNSAILKNIQLPRVIHLGLLAILSVVAFILSDYLFLKYYLWMVLLAMNVVAMAIAIPARLYNRDMLVSILLLPKVILKMFALLFRLRGANKSFIHTPHGVTELSAEEKNNQ